ncbi:sigma-70 family RNA polymerase sigma factor [bacterium]|nr:sigma-70 family RNA polymerase sigma factor [bacterium]
MIESQRETKDREEQLLICKAQSGCQASMDLLVRDYDRLAHRMASRFFLQGGEAQDVKQEALVGLAFAIRSYDPGYQRSFHEYAVMCIRNSLVRAIRGATRKKHQMLTRATELTDLQWPTSAQSTEETVLARVLLKQIWTSLCCKLSELELEVLRMKLGGSSSEEIVQTRGFTLKQIENGLFRARQKARELLSGPFATQVA